MEKVYADLVRKGIKKISDVPPKLRAAVQAILDEAENGAGGLP